MNYSTAIFLINDTARIIGVTYERGRGGDETQGVDVKAYKTLDQSIKVGDYVVVPTTTRHEMTVCKVVEVDMDVDYDAPFEYKWIIDTVYCANIENIKRQEAAAIVKIKSAEKRRKRVELRKSLLDDVDEGQLTALPLYKEGDEEGGDTS